MRSGTWYNRKVIILAKEEARRFNHDYIGTEHILLGLIREGEGVAAAVLQKLDVSLENIRLEIEKLVQPGPTTQIIGDIPFTPRAKKALELAAEEARSLGHNYIGTEHLLLGLIREGEGIAPGTSFEDLPDAWVCPECGVGKDQFEKIV